MKMKVKVLLTLLKPVAIVKDIVERLAKSGIQWIVFPEPVAEEGTGKKVVVVAVTGVTTRRLLKKVKRRRREKVKMLMKKAKAKAKDVKGKGAERKRRLNPKKKKRWDSHMKTILPSSKRRTRTCQLLRVELMKKLKTRTALRSSVSRSKRLQVSTTISLEEIPTR